MALSTNAWTAIYGDINTSVPTRGVSPLETEALAPRVAGSEATLACCPKNPALLEKVPEDCDRALPIPDVL